MRPEHAWAAVVVALAIGIVLGMWAAPHGNTVYLGTEEETPTVDCHLSWEHEVLTCFTYGEATLLINGNESDVGQANVSTNPGEINLSTLPSGNDDG